VRKLIIAFVLALVAMSLMAPAAVADGPCCYSRAASSQG